MVLWGRQHYFCDSDRAIESHRSAQNHIVSQSVKMVKSVKSVTDPDVVFVTPTEAAKILGVSKPTLYRLMDDGTLPYTEIAGVKKRRIKRSDVERLIQPGFTSSDTP